MSKSEPLENEHTFNDQFLVEDNIGSESDAVKRSIKDALQHNPTYANKEMHQEIRAEWARLLREEAQHYHGAEPIPDEQHCDSIERIARALESKFSEYLIGGRLRFGTSQKAFNLYLKYLWRMGEVTRPPHCPVDSIVLKEAKVKAAWTKSDSKLEYEGWIRALRHTAGELAVADWEYGVWSREARKKRLANRKGANCDAIRKVD